jgi:hypothetical protein
MTPEPDEHQEELFRLGGDAAPGAPLVYVGMPLSQLKANKERAHVEFLANAVDLAVFEQTRSKPEPWPLRVHSPIKLSAPWKKDELNPTDIYRLNTNELWIEADALIVLADQGGSLGIGQELEWAFDLQLPVLYLSLKGDPVSRQIEGAGSEYDLSLRTYQGPEDLRDTVGRWLVSRKPTICDGPRRRRNREMLFEPTRAKLAAAWSNLGAAEQQHIVAATKIGRGRIERMLSHPLMLAAASVQELSLLSGGLRIPAASERVAEPLPELRPGQVAALSVAAKEFDWDFETAFELHRRARLELARGGVRRLPLGSIQDWANFYERQRPA